jgi:hypothetical protein
MSKVEIGTIIIKTSAGRNYRHYVTNIQKPAWSDRSYYWAIRINSKGVIRGSERIICDDETIKKFPKQYKIEVKP